MGSVALQGGSPERHHFGAARATAPAPSSALKAGYLEYLRHALEGGRKLRYVPARPGYLLRAPDVSDITPQPTRCRRLSARLRRSVLRRRRHLMYHEVTTPTFETISFSDLPASVARLTLSSTATTSRSTEVMVSGRLVLHGLYHHAYLPVACTVFSASFLTIGHDSKAPSLIPGPRRSIAALSARRLVWSAMSSITFIMLLYVLGTFSA